MKKAIGIGLLFLTAAVWGQSFESAVDFNLDLSSLSDPETVKKAVDDGRVAILEGLMGDVVVMNDGKEAEIWVTLMGGSWVGTEEVRAYSCRILFRGDRWLEAFPGIKPREPGPEYVPQGSRLLAAVRITGHDGAGVPTSEMIDYRVLE